MSAALYDSSTLVSPSPSREKFAKTAPSGPATASPWLLSAVFIPLAYLAGGGGIQDPVFLVLAALSIALVGLVSFLASSYGRYTARNAIDVDAYCGNQPNFFTRAYVAFAHRLTSHAISREAAEASGNSSKFEEGLPLRADPSPHLEGLLVTSGRKADEDGNETLSLPTWPRVRTRPESLPVIIGTIRMGFGHHRIAYSAASWAASSGGPAYFHDLFAVESKEAQMIKDADKLYSRGSRLASELGGVVEAMWGAATLSGSENSLRQSWQMAEGVIPLMMAMDKRVPVVASHSLVGMIAVACGFRTVINCVIDNHAQWFVVVPGALNLVQGPGNYMKLRKLGVPAADLRVAGHWCPAELVNNIPDDCAARIAELVAEARPGATLPSDVCRRTFLLPIGGAGAQRRFVISLVRAVIESGLVDEGAQLVLNAGDHAHMKEAFLAELAKPGAPRYETITSLAEVREAASDRAALKRRAPVLLCCFDEYFPAVATTDIMCRAVDVLACKPSELAFYPIPKLMVRRVGDHEQFSAVRAYEIGDGTREVREVEEALEWMRLMLEPGSDVLQEMNRRIAANGAMGVYDGSKNAVQWAKKLAAEGYE
mmetsp:Transcript_6054/g.10931  ORF Transcript_6054/g.10931 Transcript_6054/m.10931 type:complete len:598 (-) Transcript_6054:264-2057(-)|eukprot:CAMPEP_0177756862 /NCGR_PEP_ID=MMETSP0491_2-20121128/3338_1 /TAXON_ID=63592 /ORGANISM="Tetraselmis chuii, Strain PLY429" /LENGTH=597 /DNA_ID=CAMNT_0019272479 /DNA_START=180 /DNA_END=1973 /DNA_ORIENTATION=+